MRRTYRSKKESGGLDPRDVIQNLDDKTSKFEGFYIHNIKHTKRELSSIGADQVPFSGRVQKKKFVKRLKEPEVPQLSPSQKTFLTPNKSLRVNKVEDLFDQLLNSSVNSPGSKDKKCTNAGQKVFRYRQTSKLKEFNYSTSDSSGSDKENIIIDQNMSPNESDLKSHFLLLDKNLNKIVQTDDSIEKVKNSLPRSINFEKEYSPMVPQRETYHRKQTLSASPICSTPIHKKYRGQSIYKYSPIVIGAECKTEFKPIPQNSTIQNISKESHNSVEAKLTETIGCGECSVKDVALSLHGVKKQKENASLNEIKDCADESLQVYNQDSSIQCQTPEHSQFLGFAKTNKSIGELLDNSETLSNEIQTFSLTESEISSEPFLGFSKTIKNLNIDSKNCDLDWSLAADSNSSYDTCSDNESLETSGKYMQDSIKPKPSLVKIARLKQSDLTRCNMKNCNVEINKSSSSINSLDHYQSFNTTSLSNNSDMSMEINNESFNRKPVSFITTRRGNNLLPKDSFLFNLDDCNGSGNISESNITVIQHESESDIKTLVEQNEYLYYYRKDNELMDADDKTPNVTVRHCNKSRDYSREMRQSISTLNNSSSSEEVDVENMHFTRSSLRFAHVHKDLAINKTSQNDKKDQTLKYREDSNTINSDTVFIDDSTEQNDTIVFQSADVHKHIDPMASTTDISEIIKNNESLSYDKNSAKKLSKNKSLKQSDRYNTRMSQKLKNMETQPAMSRQSEILDCLEISEIRNPVVLQPGKRWERSLSIYRRMTTMVDGLDTSLLDTESLKHKGRCYRQSVITTMEMQELNSSLHNESIKSHRNTFVSKAIGPTKSLTKDSSIYSTTVIEDLEESKAKCMHLSLQYTGLLTEDCDDTVVNLSKLSLCDPEVDRVLEKFHDTSNRSSTARDYVLRRCNQTDALLFDECYPDTCLKNCRKIGEGVYGEVFLWRAGDGQARVLKVIPVAGNVVVNGEKQKDYHQIISEIVIAMELSALSAPIPQIERHFDEGKNIESLDFQAVENATDVFNKVLAVRLVYGSYPSRLLDLWDLYDECKGSENDNPAILPPDQHYIVLELANAGQDLESYQFNNAEQAYALLQQVAFGLAVAEEACKFEHRDLHWGNVLIAPTDRKFATFVVRGRAYRVRTCGVKATIIDYSLSRLSLDGRVLCCDLSEDETLFDALGDYQFEVYRRMRDRLGNDWQNYEPYTNILWLHYTADKMITALRYTRTNTKVHKHYISKLKEIKNQILYSGSAWDYVTDNEI
ncbi:unnamed protein product [Leptosia nina]|uniref:non-specific serine/threonine protein kinase n=1 Tax=Leptosia nina TaxID=320188 RepID=A0AAV1K445_9NEOP